MNTKFLLLIAASLSIVLFFSRCVPDKPVCLAPPPSFYFVILDKNDKELLNRSNKDSLKLSYLNGLNREFIPNLPTRVIDTIPNTFSPFQIVAGDFGIIFKSAALKDPIFSLELGEKVIGKMQLKTFRHNEKCNDWDDVSEVRFNDKVIQRISTSGIFVFRTE